MCDLNNHLKIKHKEEIKQKNILFQGFTHKRISNSVRLNLLAMFID